MYCPECGKKTLPKARFCSGCGKQLETVPATRSGQPSGRVERTAPAEKAFFPVKGKVTADTVANTLNIMPPPGYNAGPSHGADPGYNPRTTQPAAEADQGLAASAAARGYSLYIPGLEDNSAGSQADTKTRIITVLSMICMFALVAGIPGYDILTKNVGGKVITKPDINEEYGFKIEFPPDWKKASNPARVTGHRDAVGYYFKGSKAFPEIRAIIYYGQTNKNVPDSFSLSMLASMERDLEAFNKFYMRFLGMDYQLLELKLYSVNHRDAIWMDGNGIHPKKDTVRDFTFIAFSASRTYFVKFLFDEERVEEFWPEIEFILNSIELTG